jgi:hypothetical protein
MPGWALAISIQREALKTEPRGFWFILFSTYLESALYAPKI